MMQGYAVAAPAPICRSRARCSVRVIVLASGFRSGQSARVMNHRHGLLLVVSALSIGACTSDALTSSTTGAPASSVAVSADRSLDVSYSAGVIELSFARLGQPFRAMYARVVTWSGGAWRYFGYLTTGMANTGGTLTTAPEVEIELLAGLNTDPAPDRYRAPELPPGRYLICTTLVGAGKPGEVCGELAVS